MNHQCTHFPDLFFQQVNRLGDKVALRNKDYGIWNRISWKSYGQNVRISAAGFLSMGIEPGNRVAI